MTRKTWVWALFAVLLLCSASWCSDTLSCRIFGFALDQGTSAGAKFVAPNKPILNRIGNAALEDPRREILIITWADANRYKTNHDSHNQGISGSRGGPFVDYFVDTLGVHPRQIKVLVRDAKTRGDGFRGVEIQLLEPLGPPSKTDTVRFETTTIVRNEPPMHFSSFFSLVELGIGASTHTYGDAIPVISGRIGNQTISFMAIYGNSLATRNHVYAKEQLDVRSTLIAGYVRYAPPWDAPIDFLGGWERLEERSDLRGRYVKKSEGPSLGLLWHPSSWIGVSGLWTPAEEDIFGMNRVYWEAERFRLQVTITKIWEK